MLWQLRYVPILPQVDWRPSGHHLWNFWTLADGVKGFKLWDAGTLHLARWHEPVAFHLEFAELVAFCMNFRKLHKIEKTKEANQKSHGKKQEELTDAECEWKSSCTSQSAMELRWSCKYELWHKWWFCASTAPRDAGLPLGLGRKILMVAPSAH